ncbi:MAG: hypothetical protein V1816_15240 [Pseudomonadota bacterium]
MTCILDLGPSPAERRQVDMETPFKDITPSTPYEVVVRSGPRLSVNEAETAAKLFSASYLQGEYHVDGEERRLADHSPEAFLEILREPGREVAVIRENKDLVGVILTSAPPSDPYAPVRKISHMAFWSKRAGRFPRRRALKAALRAFQDEGLSVIAAAEITPSGHQQLFFDAGMRRVTDQSEICWLLSKVLEQQITRLGTLDEQSHLSYIADVRGRRMEIKRVLYCADARGGSGFQRRQDMVRRQMALQHREHDLESFRGLARSWKKKGLFILSGFSGTIVEESGDEVLDGWGASALGLGAGVSLDDLFDPGERRIYLPAGRIEDLSQARQVLRPGLPDFLLWALRMAAPTMLLSTAPRFRVAPILSRPFSELGRTTLSDMIEALFLTDLVPDQAHFRVAAYGRTRYAWKIQASRLLDDSPQALVDKGLLLQKALELLCPDPAAPLVFFGGLAADEPVAAGLLELSRQGAPVVIFSFGKTFTITMDRLLAQAVAGRAPILGFTAGDFFDAILILEALGLSPAPLL